MVYLGKPAHDHIDIQVTSFFDLVVHGRILIVRVQVPISVKNGYLALILYMRL